MSILVMKFGGTSVGSAGALLQAAQIVAGQAPQWERLVVVVSAMSGVTDALTRGALTAGAGDADTYPAVLAELRATHHAAIDALPLKSDERGRLLNMVDEYLNTFETFCRSIHVLGEVTPRAMDVVTSLGERMSARILAALLRHVGVQSEAVDATQVVVTDDTFQNAAPLAAETRARAHEVIGGLWGRGIVPVVTGFVGATRDGVTTTLGRGGSDYTAAILGDALDADEVWIWTDVDGVMTADPRIVPDAQVIPVLSYGEVGELAYFGAKVVHPKTIRPVVERCIPVWVKNTFNPAFAGTRIAREAQVWPGAVKAVTVIKGLSMVTVEGRGMIGVPGIAARTFSAVAGQNVSVLMISQASSEQSITFVIPTLHTPQVIAAVERELSLELSRRDVDRVWSLDDVVIVTAVGAGLRSTRGIAARLFGALAQGDINVIAIAQGSSECSISLVIEAGAAAAAVRHIHREVILNAPGAAGSTAPAGAPGGG